METHGNSAPEEAAGRERRSSPTGGRPTADAGSGRDAAGFEPRFGSRSAARGDSPKAGRFVVVFLLFGTLVGIALLLLLTALVVWLSQVTGSFIASTLILGGAFALLAAGLYLLSIREAVEQIRARAETVYEVARIARSGYEWISGKVSALIGIYDLLRKG